MRVGLNYPYAWNVYGRYFGAGNPPGSEPLLDHWIENLHANLLTLRDELGMSVVRLFLLCNAHNYGALTAGGVEQPREAPAAMLEHLARMLEAFADTRMLAIPSIIDFKAFGRNVAGNGCGGRGALLTEPNQRTHFLEVVVKSFARVAASFRGSLHSLEIMNEPRWNLGALYAPKHLAGGLAIPKAHLVDFLSRALRIAAEHGLPSTVGHRFASDLRELPAGTRPQFHYYPLRAKRLGPLRLPRALSPVLRDRELEPAETTGAFLGEIGTSAEHGEPWPELDGADAAGTRERVFERLKLAREKHYPLVLLWPDREGHVFNPGLPRGGPDPLHLTPAAIEGVIRFLKAPSV